MTPNQTVYLDNGKLHLEKENWDKAVKSFSAHIELKPDHSTGYFGRGLAYFELEDWDNAIEDFTRAISLVKTGTSGYYYRAFAYFNKKEYDKALADLDKVIKSEDPKDKDLRLYAYTDKIELEEYIAAERNRQLTFSY